MSDFANRPACIAEADKLTTWAREGQYWEEDDDGNPVGPYELDLDRRQLYATLAVFYMLRANAG